MIARLGVERRLRHEFYGEEIAGDKFTLALHSDLPTKNDQACNEVRARGYARVAVLRVPSIWGIEGRQVTNATPLCFPGLGQNDVTVRALSIAAEGGKMLACFDLGAADYHINQRPEFDPGRICMSIGGDGDTNPTERGARVLLKEIFWRAPIACRMFDLALHDRTPRGDDQTEGEITSVRGYMRLTVPRDRTHWRVEGACVSNAQPLIFPAFRQSGVEVAAISIGINGHILRVFQNASTQVYGYNAAPTFRTGDLRVEMFREGQKA